MEMCMHGLGKKINGFNILFYVYIVIKYLTNKVK